MRRQAFIVIPAAILLAACSGAALAQTQAQTQTRPKPATPPAQSPAAAPAPTPAAQASEQAPTPESLGVPSFHPAMRYLESYDAGGGQRFYLFGADTTFADVVSYYQKLLKVKGELVFDQPATHMFDTGRFREETMAFPPSITVKDYTWGGMQGYPNPKFGAEPARFKTVVQIVPMPIVAAPPPIKR
jgi:hypothetical protein